jgi:uncharacterized membrane protein (DUF373 family)
VHHFVRRFLEPVQDVIVVLLAVALFAVMTRALITIGSDILASRMVYRDVISQALFVLVLMEVERLLIIYLRDHHVSVDVMVEATIVGALREAMLLIAVDLEPQRLLALTAFVVALAVILRLGDLRAPAGRACTVMRFVTPTTPVRLRTARSASSRWKFQSTSPSSVTHPFSTFTLIRSLGTVTFHSSASSAARAMSGSGREELVGSLTSRSLATAFTPFTVLTIRSAFHLSA